MKLRLKETSEQKELIAAMGSQKSEVSRPASEAFAAAIGPVVQKVLNQAGTATMIYRDEAFGVDDDPSYPLDIFFDKKADHVKVWSQNVAGGLPSSHIEGQQELKFQTYVLDSAVDFNKKYARRARLNVVSMAITRLLNEVLVKQERNAYAVLLAALANASTAAGASVISATTAGVFQLDDINRLMTKMRRISTSYAGGTSDSSYGLTDLLVSPEIKEQIRGFSYNPMNIRGVPNSDESTAIALPDAIREGLFKAAGAQEIYGVNLTELNELGTTQKYSVLFSALYSGTPSYTAASQNIVIGLDLSKDAFIRPVITDGDTGSTLQLLSDDQYVTRQDKIGFYGSLEEGRLVLDARALVGLIV